MTIDFIYMGFNRRMYAMSQQQQQKLGAQEKYCSSCGATIKKQAEMCPECGVAQDAGVSSDKDRTTAAIFAILLGGLGVHHFYLGNAGRGILYLLFCWTFIPAIVGFIEGIIYLTQSDKEFSKKH